MHLVTYEWKQRIPILTVACGISILLLHYFVSHSTALFDTMELERVKLHQLVRPCPMKYFSLISNLSYPIVNQE